MGTGSLTRSRPRGDQGAGGLPQRLGTLDVVTLSLEAMQGLILRYRLSSYPPDELISLE